MLPVWAGTSGRAQPRNSSDWSGEGEAQEREAERGRRGREERGRREWGREGMEVGRKRRKEGEDVAGHILVGEARIRVRVGVDC